MLDKMLRMNRLLDLYGPLLTDKQRSIMRWHYSEDLSLNEISEEMGISKAAASDLIRRTEKVLEKYENALHLDAKAQRRSIMYNEMKNSPNPEIHKLGLELSKMESEEIV